MKNESQRERITYCLGSKVSRVRKSPGVRALVEETVLRPQQLIQPVFVTDGVTHPLEHMPKISWFQLSDLLHEVEAVVSSGVKVITLSCRPVPSKKQTHGQDPFQSSSLLARSLKALKTSFPELVVIADILAERQSEPGREEESLVEALGAVSLVASEAGADFIMACDAPDGVTSYLRQFLNSHDFSSTGIISFAVQYASVLHPFTADGSKGAKKELVSCANRREALADCTREEAEGADMLVVSPGMTSLDTIAALREQTLLPIGAFQTLGEWAMIQTAQAKGWIEKDTFLLESLISMRRAGADFIFSYGAKEAAKLLR